MKTFIVKLILATALAVAAMLPAAAMEGNVEAKRGVVDDGYDFWLYTPRDYNGKQRVPVVIFLHGRSLCGSNMNRSLRYGPIDAVKRGLTLPMIVITPQNPGGAWRPSKIINILNWVEQHYAVDTTRVYAMGMSLGGYGTLDLAGTYPDKIAAAMAMCGGCSLSDVSGLGQLPLWILHGTADRAVPIKQSQAVVEKLEDSGNNSRLRYDWLQGATHGALARVFYLKDSYDWLLAHTTADAGRPVERYINIDNDILHIAYNELRELSKLVGDDEMDAPQP